METETEKEWLSVKEFAKRNSVTEDTVRAWCKKGLLVTAKRVNRKWFIRYGDFPGVVQPTPTTVADDPDIVAARIAGELQKVKTETATDALAERKAQMELQGCRDCEALQKSTAERDAVLTQREAEHNTAAVELANQVAADKQEAATDRQEAATDRREIENAKKFNENWKQSLEEYHEVRECLETLNSELGYPRKEREWPVAIKKLTRIWHKGLDKSSHRSSRKFRA